MNNKLKRFAWFALIGSIMAACQTLPRGVTSSVKGFDPFPSARDFDPPGQIYRVAPDGNIWKVATLEIQPEMGTEQTLHIETRARWSFKTLLETIGVLADEFPMAARIDIEKERMVTLDTLSGIREYIQDDSGIYTEVLKLFIRVPYRKNNRYYVIRETIATKQLSYRAQKKWIVDLGAEAKFKKVAAANSDLRWGDETTFSLTKEFDKPLRIWFKAEELVVKESLGVGPGGVPTFELKDIPVGSLPLSSQEITENP